VPPLVGSSRLPPASGIGLAAGAALISYETSLGALVTMGAVCGAAIGLAQVASFAPLHRHALSWTLATGALWAIGWAVTTGAGIKVEDQWPLFGITGALVVAAVQSVLINRFVPATESNLELANTGRRSAHHPPFAIASTSSATEAHQRVITTDPSPPPPSAPTR
jgi:hypothetical protein